MGDRWVGLDLGGTKVYGVVLQGREVVGQAKVKTPPEGGVDGIVATLAAVVEELGGADGVAAIGVGAPGAVDNDAGTVRGAPNLPGFADEVPLARLLQEAVKTDAPVRLDNDVSAAVLAEHQLGAGVGEDNLLGLWWGTGVGGGLILDGQLRRGPTGVAGEIGHLVVRLDGRRCGCGKRGHVEAYAGRAAMEAEARHRAQHGEKTDLVKLAGDGRMTSGVFAKALDKGDGLAEDLLDEAAVALGAAVASAVGLLDVAMVVVGGGMGEKLGELFAPRIQGEAAKRIFPGVRSFRVVPGGLGDSAGAIGAALLASSF